MKEVNDLLEKVIDRMGFEKLDNDDKYQALEIVKDAELAVVIASENSNGYAGTPPCVLAALGTLLISMMKDERIGVDMVMDVVEKSKELATTPVEQAKNKQLDEIIDKLNQIKNSIKDEPKEEEIEEENKDVLEKLKTINQALEEME